MGIASTGWEMNYCNNCRNSRRLKACSVLQLVVPDRDRKGEKGRKSYETNEEPGRGRNGSREKAGK